MWSLIELQIEHSKTLQGKLVDSSFVVLINSPSSNNGNESEYASVI